MTNIIRGGASRRRWSVLALVVTLGVGAGACDSLLDVDNPNNVLADDLLNPAAARNIVNGALYTVQQGYGYMLAPYSTLSNELHWIGSRDAWQELEFGVPTNPSNEFTDNAFKYLAQGRWMADEAIKVLEDHVANNRLTDSTQLARAYLYAAISYTSIADWMDDFALSDQRVAGPPIGPDKMDTMYDTAIDYLTKALALPVGDEMERNLLAMRARAYYSKAVWEMVGKQPISIGTPLVSDPQATADAQAALAIDDTPWQYIFDYGSSTVWSDIGWQVNGRLELRFGDDYIFPTADDNTRDLKAQDRGVKLQDPIDAIGDPRLDAIMTLFEADERYADLIVFSAAEMYLILAEDQLSQGNMTGANSFEEYINTERDFMSLSPWVSGGAGMPTAQDLLVHERQVNLYVSGRRLGDMYRFGLQGPRWQSTSPAVTNPGTFLPITKVELDANCYLNPDFECPS